MPPTKKKTYGRRTLNNQNNLRGGSGIFIVIGVFIGMLIFAIFFTAYYLFFANSTAPYSTEMTNQLNDMRTQGNYKNTFADGWAAARQRLIDSGFVMNDMTSISGTIKKINNDSLVITTGLINPLDDESLKERVIKLNSETKIVKSVWVESDSDNADPVAMGRFEEQNMTLNDLAVGNIVNVESAIQIADAKEINAVKITSSDTNTPGGANGDVPPPPIEPGNAAGVYEDVPPPPIATDENISGEGANELPPPPVESGNANGVYEDVPPPPVAE